jgi:diguanylate cyclase (GGDEF)-like protein
MKKYLIVGIVAWVAIVSGSFIWNYSEALKARQEIALQTARSFFDQIVITRKWNAQHGGVYVPVTDETQPNPYLPTIGRDLIIDTDLTLTKINPAFMTRQVSEIALQQEGTKFHITSLRPLRPENTPTLREQQALDAFEDGEQEIGEFTDNAGVPSFFYMAPLITEKTCLECHASQGYKEGDIRGGISVTLPFQQNIPVVSLAAGHTLIGLAGIIGILFSGTRIGIYTKRLQQQSVIDALTGIPNRRSFSETILREFKLAKRDRTPLSVIMCDIDHFKLYNDSYGHAAGDDCLKQVAKAMAGALKRPADFCARYGGEEFIIILPNTDESGTLPIAEQIRAAVQSLEITHDKSLPLKVVTVSLGVAIMNAEIELSDEELIKRADDSLYQAKENGRNCLVLFKAT